VTIKSNGIVKRSGSGESSAGEPKESGIRPLSATSIALSLAVLGVVYGDKGTIPITPDNFFGILIDDVLNLNPGRLAEVHGFCAAGRQLRRRRHLRAAGAA
jgi:hypothetical protein